MMKEEYSEKFCELLKIDTLEECEEYITQLYANYKISDTDFDFNMGIIVGFRMCYIDHKMIIDEYMNE